LFAEVHGLTGGVGADLVFDASANAELWPKAFASLATAGELSLRGPMPVPRWPSIRRNFIAGVCKS
jgi:threonine dehydrogenase-like Zn-dependent dehydrogenase